jgi:hypothetical protein
MNGLTAFSTTVLLGLFALVDPKRADHEVRTKITAILEILEIGRSVAHAVDRVWTPKDGETRRKRYQGRRFNPAQCQRVHEVLLQLHKQQVVLQRRNPRRGVRREDRFVHLLDSFGYEYRRDGSMLDVDNLPRGQSRTNVGTPERPVWKVHRTEGGREVPERPTGVLFRLNHELAEELMGNPGTIHFTLMARRIFGVLRAIQHNPVHIRLLLMILRQRDHEFHRSIRRLIGDLGCDPTHPNRAWKALETALETMKKLGVVASYTIDPASGMLAITKCMVWNGPAVGQKDGKCREAAAGEYHAEG